MKTTPVLFLTSLALASSSPADLFTLKNGSVLDAEIVRETADSFVLDVKVSRSIRDERTVKKSDVAKHEKIHPSEAVFKNTLTPLVPVPDFCNEEEYTRRIKIVEKFLADHPSSPKTKAAREMKDLLTAEAEAISKGAVKYKGNVLFAEEYARNRYELDAHKAENRVISLLAQGELSAALREYGKMSVVFSHTIPYCRLAPTMHRAASVYLEQITSLQDSYEVRMKKRQEGLSQMSPLDRRAAQAAIAEETALFDKRFQIEKEAKVGWISVDPNHLPSIKETLTYGKQEITKLAAISPHPSPDAGELYRKAASLIEEKARPESISQAIAAARTAKVPEDYTKELEEIAKSNSLPPVVPEPPAEKPADAKPAPKQ